MKKNCTLLLGLAMTALLQLALVQNSYGQGTDGQGLILRLTINGVNYELILGSASCGYETATWGGSVTDEFCADAAWGYDITPDSLGCDSIPAGSLTGKVAMIRRGACEFGLKALNAEKAGAVAVLIVNGATAVDDCDVIPMGAGAVGAQVTVPVLMIGRATANQIDAAFQAGQTVEVCYILPNVTSPFVAAAYATPSAQVDSIDLMSHTAFNRGTDTIFGMVIKADISGPNGYTNSIVTPAPPLEPGFSGLVFFDTYLPPNVPGKYDVVMSNNLYTESRDTLRRSFEVTDYTFAVDNLNLIDARLWNNTSFQAGGLIYQTGALYFTGPNQGVATYSSFGISNIDSIYTGNSVADVINVLLYDADSDDDGILNFQAGGFDDISGDVVALGSYILQGTETFSDLVHVPLEDFFIGGGEPPMLKANHAYYISLLYDGTENGSGRCPGFNASSSEDYLVYDGDGLTTPLLMDALYSGWGGGTLVNRLQMEGFDPLSSNEPKSNSLDASKFSITPNPGNEYVNLNLDLESVNERVAITILTPSGRLIRSQHLSDFQSGQIRFDVKDVPSGTYLMWIRTAEGVTIKQVAICH